MLRAGIVLWGKVDPETQVVSVLAVVSFGTVDLTDDEKGLFEEARMTGWWGLLIGHAQRVQSWALSKRELQTIGI
jgi:hypothetical protein